MTSTRVRHPAPKPAGGVSLGHLFGVELRLDGSLLVIFALVTVNLGAGALRRWHPDWSAWATWSLALGAAALFFLSLLAHELAHALVARRQGVPVSRVTLFLFGGLAHLEGEPASPRAELLIAAVGPLTSLILGVLATVAGVGLAGPALQEAARHGPEAALAAMQSVGPLATTLLWLGPVNLFLGLFNLVPGFPLDGGRVLRALLWRATGDLTQATRWASTVGQVVAWGLMGVGVVSVLDGLFANGLWLLLVGWFLNNAARVSYQQRLVRQALEDMPVTRLMRTRVETVGPTLSVDELVREHVLASDQHAFPVEQDGVLQGLVSFEDLRKVPQAEWPRTSVATVMTPLAELATLTPDADAEDALEELAQHDVEQVPVLDAGAHLLGVVRRQDLVRWIALHRPPQHHPA
jgi:Zn-dependent protease/CBS domain-containing protein